MKTKHRVLLEAAIANDYLSQKLVIECWNAENPHFGGGAGHRYDGASKECAYCFRPKDWKRTNPIHGVILEYKIIAKRIRG